MPASGPRAFINAFMQAVNAFMQAIYAFMQAVNVFMQAVNAFVQAASSLRPPGCGLGLGIDQLC